MYGRLSVTALAACLLVSCDRSRDPGLVEKLALLEAELRDRDDQLTRMREVAAENASSSSAESQSSAPDVDAARGSYLAFVETVRGKLSEAMPEVKLDRTSVFPVEGPDPSKPIFSKVAFRIVGKDGRAGEIVVPVFADTSGSWQDPEVDEAVAAFKTKLATPPPVAARETAPPAAPQAEPQRPKPNDVMGANRTFEVQWGDEPKRQGGQGGQAQPAPQPPPQQQQQAPPQQPQQPAVPKKVMPTSRDVIIDFE